MLVKIGLLLSVSVLFGILLMFLGYIKQSEVLIVSFFILLAVLSYSFIEKSINSKNPIYKKGIFSLKR